MCILILYIVEIGWPAPPTGYALFLREFPGEIASLPEERERERENGRDTRGCVRRGHARKERDRENEGGNMACVYAHHTGAQKSLRTVCVCVCVCVCACVCV